MRIKREKYFMEIAKLSAKRGTCDRALVGAIAVKDRRIIMSSYNGSPSGIVHCSESGHLLENNHCIRTIHAEMNIITQCAKHSISLKDAEIYVTHQPCFHCMKHMISAGVKRVYYNEGYSDERITVDYYTMLPVIHLPSMTKVDIHQVQSEPTGKFVDYNEVLQ